MKTLELNLKGRIPSKKNSRIQIMAGTRRINIPSKQYQAWHKTALLQLPPARIPIGGYVCVSILFTFPDHRACDLTNKAESVMDLLVDKGILHDDAWQYVQYINLVSLGVDKNNPGCRIVITHGETHEFITNKNTSR